MRAHREFTLPIGGIGRDDVSYRKALKFNMHVKIMGDSESWINVIDFILIGAVQFVSLL